MIILGQAGDIEENFLKNYQIRTLKKSFLKELYERIRG